MRKLIAVFLGGLFLLLSCGCSLSCVSDESIAPLPNYVEMVRIGKVKESFLCKEENRIRNVTYYDSNGKECSTEDNLPAYRVIMVQDQDTLMEAIEEDLFDDVIDFELGIVFIVVFSVYGNYRVRVDSVEKKDAVLEVTILRQSWGYATQPVLQSVILKLKKIDIDEIEVIFTK